MYRVTEKTDMSVKPELWACFQKHPGIPHSKLKRDSVIALYSVEKYKWLAIIRVLQHLNVKKFFTITLAVLPDTKKLRR